MVDTLTMETKTKAAGGGAVALVVALTGAYTAFHGTHTTNTADSKVPVVVNRPHDINGSPLPVTVSKLPNGAPLIIVGHGAPPACLSYGSASQPLPDKACTPGVVDHSVTVTDLCPHLGKTVVRAVSQKTKDEVRSKYGDDRAGEIDHLISLELGGSNDIKNLWPEDGKIPNPKDAVENRLHAWVCSAPSAARLAQAQKAIATNWTTADQIIR